MSGDAALEDPLLDQLAQLGLGMARRLHDVSMATDDPLQLAALGTAFHQVSRGVRQSLALKARFAAGTPFAERPAREATAPPPPASPPRIETERTGWNEYGRLDCDELLEELDRILEVPEGEPLDFEHADRVFAAVRTQLRRDLTVVSRNPALAAIPALQPHAKALSARAALLGGGSLRVVDSS